MKTKEALLLEAVELLKRAAGMLQDMTAELDGDMNNALAAEIEEFLNKK